MPNPHLIVDYLGDRRTGNPSNSGGEGLLESMQEHSVSDCSDLFSGELASGVTLPNLVIAQPVVPSMFGPFLAALGGANYVTNRLTTKDGKNEPQ
jgi:hypothetical protein